MDQRAIGIVGVGQLGALFGMGFLKLGRSVHPVRRGEDVAALVPLDPALVLLAVGERDLDPVLEGLAGALRDRVVLVSNELLPPDWERHGIASPTVAVVWFEKKRGRAPITIRSSQVAGPGAELVISALTALDLPARRIDERDLVFELVRKNLYILTANFAGLEVGGTTGDLCTTHRELATEILEDVIAVEEARLGRRLPHDSLLECAFLDFARDPNHGTLGRTAPERLARALERAERLGAEVPVLRRIAERHLPGAR